MSGYEKTVSEIEKIYKGLSSYASLLSSWQSLPVSFLTSPPESYPQHTWIGQIFARRELHRSLIFLSLCADGTHGCYSRVEVVIRRDVFGDERMRNLLYDLRLGDIVRVSGALERPKIDVNGKPLMVATSLECIKAWPLASEGFASYDRFASPPLPVLIGLPSFYVKQMLLETITETNSTSSSSSVLPSLSLSSSLSAALSSSSSSSSSAQSSSSSSSPPPSPHHQPICEAWYRGVPLHRLCRRFVASKECHSLSCRQLHSLEGFNQEIESNDNGSTHLSLPDVSIEWEKFRRRVRALGLPVHADDKNAGDVDHRAGHSQRALAFSDWLLKTVPRSILYSGIVLDIAGGKGDVARSLARQGINVVTVDPRSPKKVKLKRNQSGTAMINTRFVTGKTQSLPSPLVDSHGSHTHIVTKFDDQFIKRYGADLLSKVKLVIGFHPDEATEPAVNFSIKTSTPCCIVPCCVFGKLFPDRRLNGREVTSFDDFVLYLKEKFRVDGKEVRTSFLEYLGANLVLHCGIEDE